LNIVPKREINGCILFIYVLREIELQLSNPKQNRELYGNMHSQYLTFVISE
jgi:hypothetical protein